MTDVLIPRGLIIPVATKLGAGKAGTIFVSGAKLGIFVTDGAWEVVTST